MAFQKGDRVKHPVMADWGIGEVLESSEGVNISVFFAEVGEKKLCQTYVELLKVKREPHSVLDNLPANAGSPAGKKKRSSKKPRVVKVPRKALASPIIEKH